MAVSRAAATAKFKARPGTFGDVFKYSFLTRLLAHQRGPNRPFTFVDVFGGTGVAQLAGLRKAHGPSAVDDLWSLFGHPRVASKLTGTGKQIFQEVAPFVKALRRYNPAAYTATTELSEKLEQAAAKTNLPSKTTDILNQMPGLEYLPRAPLIGAYMMRHQDNATFVEENPENFEVLSELFKTDRRVKVFNGKPEQLARALLPTRTHKGLMFMDPDYSLTETRARVTEVISSSFHRWPGGTYAVYYPFDPEVKVWVFEELKKVGFRNILGVEINFAPQWPDVELVAKLAPFHVGMAIVNAPYNFDSEAEQLCENLLRLFMPHFEQPHLPHWNSLKRGLPIFSAEDQRIVDEKLISDHLKRCVNIFWGTDKMPLQLFDQSDTTTNLDVKRITEHTLHEENSLLNLARNRGQKLEDSRLNSQLRSRKKGDDKKSSVEYISLKPAHAEEFFVTMDPRSKNYKTRVPTNIAIEPPINEVDDIMVSGPSSGRKFVEKIAHYDVKRHESTRLVDPIEEDEKERAARLVQAAEAGAKLLEQAQKEAAAAPKQ